MKMDEPAKLNELANFPQPPAGMKLRVKQSRNGLRLFGFHTISTARHYIEKSVHLLFFAPFCFSLGVMGPLYLMSRIVFFHEPVYNENMEADMPRWAVLTFVVPFLALFPLVFGYATWYIAMQAIQMTPDRPTWELDISPNAWRIRLYLKYSHSDGATETRVLDPSRNTKIGVDVGGRVYAQEVAGDNDSKGQRNRTIGDGKDVSARVDLTMGLLPAEAAWVEQALRALLPAAPTSDAAG